MVVATVWLGEASEVSTIVEQPQDTPSLLGSSCGFLGERGGSLCVLGKHTTVELYLGPQKVNLN